MSNISKPTSTIYTFLSLGLVLIIDAMVMGLIFPIIGPLFISKTNGILPIAASIQTRDFWYSATMGIFFIFCIIGAPFFGDLSDQLGRKKVLLLCLSGTCISCLIAGVAISIKSVALLLFCRALAGLCAGSQGLSQAAIIDISTPENKARNISFIGLAACIGFVIGPLIGGIFSDKNMIHFSNFTLPFLIAAVFALINAVSLVFTFRETFFPAEKKSINISKGLILILEGFRHPNLKILAWIFMLTQMAWGLYFQFVSLLLTQVDHYNTGKIGLFMAFVGLIFVLSLMLIVPYCVKIFRPTTLTLFGLILVFIGIFINALFTSSIVIHWLSVVPIAIGEAFVFTNLLTLFSNSVDAKVQGWAMGVNSAIGAFAWGIAALSLSFLSTLSFRVPFVVGSILIIVSYIILHYYAPHYHDQAHTGLHHDK